MNRLIGHAEANKRLIQNGAYCIDIINQNLAVIAALHKVNEIILEGHLTSCVKDALRSKNPKQHQKAIDELMAIYKKYQHA